MFSRPSNRRNMNVPESNRVHRTITISGDHTSRQVMLANSLYLSRRHVELEELLTAGVLSIEQYAPIAAAIDNFIRNVDVHVLVLEQFKERLDAVILNKMPALNVPGLSQ